MKALYLLPIAVLLTAENAAWNKPFPPHRIADNLYYVGTSELSTYLIATTQGCLLINPSYDSTVPQILQNIGKLGFHSNDIKILLISHAHDDHAAGCARMKQLTGAKLMVMEQDAAEVEAGGKGDFQYHDQQWPPVKIDRVLRDGDKITLGDTALTAHLTPGHTKGCTTWTMRARLGGRERDVVIVGSPNVNPGYQLVGNKLYPGIAQDYETTFRVLKSLPCDIFLGAHPGYYGMAAKHRKLEAGDSEAFVDPPSYRAYIEDREQAFRKELARQRH